MSIIPRPTLTGIVIETPGLVTRATHAAGSAIGTGTRRGGVMTHVVAIAVAQIVVVCRPVHTTFRDNNSTQE